MSKTESAMIPLGSKAFNFKLQDVVTGTVITLEDSQKYLGTVIMFLCNHCPYVKHINAELTRLASEYIPQNIRFIAISSNDIEHYPDDAPEFMQKTAQQEQYPFPYLYDATQEVAQAYQAACTPDFFIYDKNLTLVYRGQLDDSRPGNNIPVSGLSIRTALDCLLNQTPIDPIQKPSLGCNIKWKHA